MNNAVMTIIELIHIQETTALTYIVIYVAFVSWLVTIMLFLLVLHPVQFVKADHRGTKEKENEIV